jgi:bacteriocin biosynthesis cyclodehydratase domain-containing protein
MRPTLLPNLRRLWRDAQTLQLGSDPESAVVLRLARPDVSRALDLLDGSATTPGLIDAAAGLGLDGGDVREIVETLRNVGLVLGAHELTPSGLPEGLRRRLSPEGAAIALRRRAALDQATDPPAEALRRRAEAHVLVAGDGPLVAPVAAILAAAGVGHVDPALDGLARPGDVLVGGFGADDVDQPRTIAAGRAVNRVAPGTNLSPVRASNVTFVIPFGPRQSPALAARGFRLRHVPRLEVAIRLGTVVVGPFVRPHGSPCLTCLDLHRRDRDPAWPVLQAQLATAPAADDEPCGQTTALAGAAFAADEVLAYLDGTELRTEGAIVEIARPGEIRRRIWTAHPRCDCRRRRRGPNAG